MAIALFALSALPHPLQALARGFQQLAVLTQPRGGGPCMPNAAGPTSSEAGAGRPGAAAIPAPGGNRAGSGIHPRPLRGNWPFTVQPRAPQPAPATGGPPPASAHRAALHAAAVPRPTAGRGSSLRRITGSGTGRIVLSGRMADVCAELDRLAALEAAQA